jgi:hypothetical protein
MSAVPPMWATKSTTACAWSANRSPVGNSWADNKGWAKTRAFSTKAWLTWPASDSGKACGAGIGAGEESVVMVGFFSTKGAG